MQLTEKKLEKLIQLARIQCTEEERESLLKDLGDILKYVEQLQEVDTSNVAPCNHLLSINNAMREDRVDEKRMLSRETFLKNAPEHIGGMLRVPQVLRSSSKKQPS